MSEINNGGFCQAARAERTPFTQVAKEYKATLEAAAARRNSTENAAATGAVRSADADHMDFTSLPLIGLIGVARTAGEGATKYGRYNYMMGMPVHQYINHAFRHLVMNTLGDRSEPHLEHAAWNILAAIQSYTLDPELNAKHLLGPGATITPEMKADLDANRDDLAAKRKAGVFVKVGEWSLHKLAEIQTILGQRHSIRLETWHDGLPPVIKYVGGPTEMDSFRLAVSETELGHMEYLAVDDEGFAVIPSRGGVAAAEEIDQYEKAKIHSTGNPTADAWLGEKTHHSHSPLATRKQNNAPRPKEHVQGDPTDLKTPAEAFAASISRPTINPAVCGHANLDHVERKCRDCGATRRQIMMENVAADTLRNLSRKSVKIQPFQNGDLIEFGHHPKSTPAGYFPEVRTESHKPLYPDAVKRALIENRGAKIRADVVKALCQGKISQAEFDIWEDGGPLPQLFYTGVVKPYVKPGKAGGNPESFDYYVSPNSP